MGREIRRVPANWEHPKNTEGNYIPLMDGFNKRLANWEEENAQWQKGMQRGYGRDEAAWVPMDPKNIGTPFSEWDGERPDQKDYMPDWPEAERTHLQMYEDTSEGTPISPVCATPEECARWLADNNASAFGRSTATYEQWLATCKAGWAPSMIFGGGKGMRSGVEASTEL